MEKKKKLIIIAIISVFVTLFVLISFRPRSAEVEVAAPEFNVTISTKKYQLTDCASYVYWGDGSSTFAYFAAPMTKEISTLDIPDDSDLLYTVCGIQNLFSGPWDYIEDASATFMVGDREYDVSFFIEIPGQTDKNGFSRPVNSTHEMRKSEKTNIYFVSLIERTSADDESTPITLTFSLLKNDHQEYDVRQNLTYR